jgi:hypothetical protein
MAYFMVPRFVEFAAQLPKTMTEKVEKYKLRGAAEQRLGEIWDREKAGIPGSLPAPLSPRFRKHTKSPPPHRGAWFCQRRRRAPRRTHKRARS